MEIKAKGPVKSRKKKGWKSFYVSTRHREIAKVSGKGEIIWFSTLAEARRKADELNAAQHTGGVVTRAEVGTLKALHDLFVKDVDKRVADPAVRLVYKSGENYKKNAADWVSWLGANIKVPDITKDMISHHLKTQLSARKKLMSDKTKREKLNAIRDMLEIARDLKWRGNDNVAKSVKLKSGKAIATTEAEAVIDHVPSFDVKLIRKLIDNAYKLDEGNAAWCDGLATAFNFQTGLRFGEQAALRWKALDLKNKKRVYVRTAQRVVKEGVAIGGVKTDFSKRYVKLTPTLVNALIAWRLRSPFSDDNDLVFPTRVGTGQKSGDNWRNRVLHPLCDATKDEHGTAQERLRWHDGRHFFASMLLLQFGKDWMKIAERMGHANASFTKSQYGKKLELDDSDDGEDPMAAMFN